MDEDLSENAAGADEEALEDDGAVDHKKKWRRRILWALLVLLLLLLAYILWLWWWTQHNIHQADLLPNEPGNSQGENILLIGSDSRDLADLNDNARADVIQLVHIDATRHTASVIHFPRDLYVTIPCGQTHCAAGGQQLAPNDNKSKINAAFSWGAVMAQPGHRSEGGSQLLVKTLEDLLSSGTNRFHIDHVMITGFCGFAHLTDDLGGVDIHVSQPFEEGVIQPNADCRTGGGAFGTWSQGTHHMTGIEALGFVRERHNLKAGDIDRGKDQQAWMAAVFRKLTHSGDLLNPIKLPQIISDGLSNTIVDQHMGIGYFMSLGKDVALNNLKVSYFTAPWQGFANVNNVGSVVNYDAKAMADLGFALRSDQMATYAGVPNQVN